MAKKNIHMVIDCESLDLKINKINTMRVAVNWGITLGDNQGNVLAKNDYIIDDIYNMPLKNCLNGFYIGKLQEIEDDETTVFLKDFKVYYDLIINTYKELSEKANLSLWSYNAEFDYGAFILNAEYFLDDSERDFYTEELISQNWYCLQVLACEMLLNTENYKAFAITNMQLTDTGNYSTTAEACYRYIINNPDFEEDHTGMSDSLIEYEILMHCIKKKKKMIKERRSSAWRIVNTKTLKRSKKVGNVLLEASKGQVFWDLENDNLPKNVQDTKFIKAVTDWRE